MYIRIVSVYVDDINIIGKRHDINEARHHLTEFEMKDLGETKLCLSLQLEYFIWDVCIARELYIENIGCLFDPHDSKSQTNFVFLYGGINISWKYSKQTLVSTSTNHSEIIA
jgi:hypothetical protein